MPEPTLDELYPLIARLERLSADSGWAHRAAGLRGCLLKALAEIEAGNAPPEALSDWMEQSYAILIRAAREIPADTPGKHAGRRR
jgi:hypothetical protein